MVYRKYTLLLEFFKHLFSFLVTLLRNNSGNSTTYCNAAGKTVGTKKHTPILLSINLILSYPSSKTDTTGTTRESINSFLTQRIPLFNEYIMKQPPFVG